MAAEKPCIRCSVIKPLDDYPKDGRMRDGRKNTCKECTRSNKKPSLEVTREYNKNWASRNPDARRNYNLVSNFGITVQEYDALLLAQNNGCAICGKECRSGNRLAVDHDHNTGEVRALLCMKCNKFVVGNQTLETARAVVAYLENPPARVFFGGPRYVPEGKEKPKRRKRKRRTIKRKGA